MPSDLFLKTANTAHRVLLKASGGRLGWKVADMPVLSLTTTGRRSGKARTVLLTSPVQADDSMLVVASRGGDDHHPAWFLNLRADANVEVETSGGGKTPMTARTVESLEREELWERVTSTYDGYADYQSRTDRQIPLVMLEPKS